MALLSRCQKDDTTNPKYGKHFFRSGFHHSSSGPYEGQKVLILALVDADRKVALPLSYIFLTKKDDPFHEKASKRALDELKQVLSRGFPKLPVTTDSWFDSVDFITGVCKLGLQFCGEIKSNRMVQNSLDSSGRWKKLPEQFDGKKEPLPQEVNSKGRKKRRKYFSEISGKIKKFNQQLKIIGVANKSR